LQVCYQWGVSSREEFDVLRKTIRILMGVAWMVVVAGCLSASEGSPDVTEDQQFDVEDTSELPPADAEPEVQVDVPPEAEAPKCLDEVASGKSYAIPGLTDSVQVVTDKWGVPHVYAKNADDLFAAHGFVTAMDRIIQMQGMRLILRGTFADTNVGEAGDLSNDVYMRLLGMQVVTEKMWTDVQANEPEVKAVLEAYARGVTAYIDLAKAGKVAKPLEWDYLGHWDAWTPVDTLMIGRLQSWDLSFDHNTDEISMAQTLSKLLAKVKGTPLEALAMDAYRIAPATDATIRPVSGGGGGPRGAAPSIAAVLAQFPDGYLERVSGILAGVKMRPGTVRMGAGSNSWAVSGSLTATGKAILANDPHLALRNPAVFHLVHLDTAAAGGDLALAGVSFPGIPGIILGHSQHGAWSGTVHDYDVTDVYVEKYTPAAGGKAASVELDGKQVDVVVRKEQFTYAKPAKGCEDFIEDFVKGLSYAVKEEAGKCVLDVDIEVVPHHGPIIPGTKAKDAEGKDIAMTWRWTGFEPTKDLKAVVGLWKAKTTDDVKAALAYFGVGAQNWLWAGVDGHIVWAPFARVPIRKHLDGSGTTTYPPWLPMPGTGCCEWTGDVPIADLPQAVDPAEGWIATANNDPLGYTLDNNPLNDARYLGCDYDIGFREKRIQTLLSGLFTAGKKVTVEDMQAIQADHVSPLGVRLTPEITKAVQFATEEAATPGTHPELAGVVALLTADVKAAAGYLEDWDGVAESGVGDGVTEAQKKSSIAASVFNAWLVFVQRDLLENKGLAGLEDQYKGRLLTALFTAPDKLATWDATAQDSLIWDDLSTAVTVESRHVVILKALSEAVAWLSDPAKVGPKNAGGFGTTDMTKWTWGSLHTLTLPHALGGEANIPPESKYPDGYPRHGDQFNVDACNPGISNLDFRYTHGPSNRPVFLLDADIPTQNVLPGGQSGAFPGKHYSDEFYLYVANQTHPLDFTQAAVIADAESCTILAKP
jgi:penicillin amidase